MSPAVGLTETECVRACVCVCVRDCGGCPNCECVFIWYSCYLCETDAPSVVLKRKTQFIIHNPMLQAIKAAVSILFY